MPVNKQKGNARQGLPYRIVNAPGGVRHVYANGASVFVPKAAAPAAPRSPAAGVGGSGMFKGYKGDYSEFARPGAAPPANSAAAAPSPYAPDAQYDAETAADRFARQQQLGQLDQGSAYAKDDLQEALRRMTGQQPKDIQASRENANRSNLFYSGHQSQAEGDINTGYVRQRADAQQTFDRGEAARQAARRAIESGASVDEAASLAASIDRQTVRDTASADAGVLTANPAPPASGKVATAKTGVNPKTGKKFRIVRVGGRTYHYYADGHKVRV